MDEILTLSPFEKQIAADILRQLKAKLGFLLRVGLELSHARAANEDALGRRSPAGVPRQSTRRPPGRHPLCPRRTDHRSPPADTDLLAGILKELAAVGNTVVVVEHDRHMIESADYLVELGP